MAVGGNSFSALFDSPAPAPLAASLIKKQHSLPPSSRDLWKAITLLLAILTSASPDHA